jgi:hypothetical protein
MWSMWLVEWQYLVAYRFRTVCQPGLGPQSCVVIPLSAHKLVYGLAGGKRSDINLALEVVMSMIFTG